MSDIDEYEKAVELFEAEQFDKAVPLFKKLAKQGHADAQYYLGAFYYYGNGVQQDYAKAAEWYRKAAEQGDASAQFNLGMSYYRGEGVPENNDKAVEWFRKAAEQGNKFAQCNLGDCYENGNGVPQDFAQAAEWYRKAAEQGCEDALEKLAELEELPMSEKKTVTISGKEFEVPGGQLYCEQCGTTNYIYDDMNPPYHCADCGKPLNTANTGNSFDEYRKERVSCRTRAALNLTTQADLKNLLKPLVKKATRLIVKEPTKETHAAAQTKSHFCGQPYFEKGEKWPTAQNGKKLNFVFQVFNDETIELPEHIKLVQFFYNLEDKGAWQTEDDGWRVKVYETLNRENITLIKNPRHKGQSVPYCEIEFAPTLSLPDYYSIWDYDETAAKLSRVLDEDNKDTDSYAQATAELTADEELRASLVPQWKNTRAEFTGTELGSQIGGYPQWVQFGKKKKENFDFLFQIDSEENAGLMWYDCGMVYVFYNHITKETEFLLECC